MIIYIDILFLINIFMNYIICLVAVKLSKQNTTKLRTVAAVILSTVYSCLMVIEKINFIYKPYVKILFSVILIFILFKIFNLKQFLRSMAYFYIATFLTGGAMTAIFYFTDFGAVINSIMTNNTMIFDIDIKAFVVFGILIYLMVFIVSSVKHKNYKKFKIKANNEDIDLVGLVDSGNLLYEPVSKLPVFIIERDAVKVILKKDKLNKEELMEEENFKLIYFKSLGQENGELLVFPAEAVIDNVSFKIYIGVYDGQLNKNYQAIIHSIN